MNLQNFETLCQDCCFSRQLEAKQTAEKQVYAFIEDGRNSELLYQILQQWQQTSTLFVISEYLVKIILSERGLKGFITQPSQEITILHGQCYTTEELNVLQQKYKLFENITLLMSQNLSKPLESHVQNSTCNLIGLLIQQMLMISGQSFDKFVTTVFQPFFVNQQNTQLIHIGLKLIQNTLQNIQMYQQYDSYISYRRIMFAFQGQDLLSFLSTLGQVLSANNPALVKPAVVSLRDVLMFNFNVSYFELETDFDPNDQNNVNFPEKFAEYFADPVLIKLLFGYVIQFLQTDVSVSINALKCLKRMVSSRKRVFTEKIRRRMFTKDMFDGARLLFDQIHQNVSDEIVSDVMEFNAKLNLNFGLRQVRFEYAFCINWLYSLQTFCIAVLQKQIKIKDNHIKQMMELMKKLCKYTSDFKLDNQLKISIAKSISEVGKAIVHILLNSQSSFFTGYNPQNFKKLKHALKDFFESLFPILQLDLMAHMKTIYSSFAALVQSQDFSEKFVVELSMINYVIINPAVLDRQPGSTSELSYEGQQLIITIVRDMVQFIKNSRNDKINPLIQMSLMNLTENMLQYSLSEIDDGIGKQRNQKQFFQNFMLPIQDGASNTTTQLLLEYLCYTLSIENKEIILYALQIMKETIIRLKHHLFSEVFQSLSIITNIKAVLLNLKNSALQKPLFYCCRTQSAEILSILMLDSAFENYIQSIISISDQLTLQPTLESIEIYLYEMLGYFRFVDVSKIFRLLIKQHLSKIQDLAQFILVSNPQQFDLCKLCLKLMVAITDNKALRFQYYSSSIVQIELVRSFQVILTSYCNHLLEAIKDDKVKQDYSSQICRMLGLVYKIMHNILKGKYISQACQLLFGDRKYLDLLIVALELGTQIASYMILYNKACLQMVQVLQIVSATQLQLLELSPTTLNKLLQIVEIIQGSLLGSLYEEYRTQNTTQYAQQTDKTSLIHTTEILQNTLEFVSEEQQLASLNVVQSFIQPLDQVIESILRSILTCILRGQCSQITNNKLATQVFAILCTHQQPFIRILCSVLFATTQQMTEDQWRILTADLDLRIKQQNVEQFRKNFNKLLQSLAIPNIEY